MSLNQFSGMSNFEINQEVAISLGLSVSVDEGFEQERLGDSLSFYDENRTLHTVFEDYCESTSLL